MRAFFLTSRVHGKPVITPAMACLLSLFSCLQAAAADPPPRPPEIIELEPITVQERREREIKRIEDESARFQEELERKGRPEKTEITETRDNDGNTNVKVRTRWLTYCYKVPKGAPRNNLGENFSVPTNCER